MYQNGFDARLASQDTLLGFNNCLPNPGVIEVLAPGWDFAWIDGQHGYHDYASIHAAVVACRAAGILSLIRVPGHGAEWLERCCDLAPDGILVPMIESRDQAREVLDHIHFPPIGNRSYGGRRIFDLHGPDLTRVYRSYTMLQIESPAGVDVVEDIASLDGVDALFIGPDDLKLRLGLPRSTDLYTDPKLRAALERTIAAARAHGKEVAIPAIKAADARQAREMGMRILVGGADAYYLRTQNALQLEALAFLRQQA